METPRRGLTIIEMLVVISIIGMILALVFPAVQAAREAGRRNTCKNNLRNIALAIANHESAHARLPSNGWGFQWFGDPDRGTGINQPGGWIYNILPFVERRDLALAVLGASQPDAVKRQLAAKANQTVVGLFYCPSRRGAALYPYDTKWPPKNADLVAQTSKTDYAINAGDVFIRANGPKNYQQAADPRYVWTSFAKATGVSFFRSTIAIA